MKETMKTTKNENNIDAKTSIVGVRAPFAKHTRTPWVGGVSPEEMKRPGGLLISNLLSCANERGQQLNDMACELGITYGYINQLRTGHRPISEISTKLTLACARYLGVPQLTVMLLSGKITSSSMFESEEMKATQIEDAMSLIYKDPVWGPLFTFELRKGSLESKYCLVRLYESATKKVLMDGSLSTTAVDEKIMHLCELQARRARLVKKEPTQHKDDKS